MEGSIGIDRATLLRTDWCRWRLTYALRVVCVTAAGEVFGLKWEAAKLDTGLGVVRVAMPGQSGLLSYYSIVRAGARNEVEVSPPPPQIQIVRVRLLNLVIDPARAKKKTTQEGVTGFAHFFEVCVSSTPPPRCGEAGTSL